MRILLCLIIVLCCWKWGDVKNWGKYYSTILYLIVNQLLYSFFVGRNHFLWKLEDDFLLNQTFSVLIQTFIFFPCLVVLLLSNFPKNRENQIIYFIVSATILCGIEGVMYFTGRITYHNGWNFWWSIAFNFIMVFMLRFHYLKPIPAWIVSFLFTAVFILYFHVPLPEH